MRRNQRLREQGAVNSAVSIRKLNMNLDLYSASLLIRPYREAREAREDEGPLVWKETNASSLYDFADEKAFSSNVTSQEDQNQHLESIKATIVTHLLQYYHKCTATNIHDIDVSNLPV